MLHNNTNITCNLFAGKKGRRKKGSNTNVQQGAWILLSYIKCHLIESFKMMKYFIKTKTFKRDRKNVMNLLVD